LLVVAKLRQLSTRCSRFSVRQNRRCQGWFLIVEKDSCKRTFPCLVVLCFAFPLGDFLVLLPCFETFVRQVHLDCPMRQKEHQESEPLIQRHSQRSSNILSASQLFVNQQKLRLCPHLRFEWGIESLKLCVVIRCCYGEVESFQCDSASLIDRSIQVLAFSLVRKVIFSLSP
jgi:hypothetical protein